MEELHDLVAGDQKSRSVIDGLKSVDLASVKIRLQRADENRWTSAKLAFLETEYKKFLWLSYRYSGESIVPSEDIDEIWHTHILDTRKYEADCLRIFGYFLHHVPAVAGDNNAEFETTRDLYRKEFGTCAGLDEYVKRSPCCNGCQHFVSEVSTVFGN